MRTFLERMASASEFELTVLDALRDRGWSAERFGQGQLGENLRDHLRKVDTPVRWMPDIIAAKPFAARTIVVFIDAKAGQRYRDTGNHDLEVSALESAERWIEYSSDACPHYFVFQDWGVTTPAVVRELGWRGSWRGFGSGTPFLLFPVTACRPFDAIFGEPYKESK
jgi:hypothetical protein